MNIKRKNNSNMIGYRSLFSKNKMDHLQIPNINNIIVPITFFSFLTLHLDNSNKRANYIKSHMATILFLGINFHIPFMLKVK